MPARGLLVAVLPGVGVDGGRQQVGLAFGLEVLQQPDVLVDQRHARPGLDEGPAGGLGLGHGLGEILVLGDRALVAQPVLDVGDVLAGRPGVEDGLALGQEILPGHAVRCS